MASGGKRLGAGRPPGARNRKTVETIRAVEESGMMTPLAYMLSVIHDTGHDTTIRLEAARAAAPYMHARLSNSEITLMQPGDEMTTEEITDKLAQLLADDPSLLSRVMNRH